MVVFAVVAVTMISILVPTVLGGQVPPAFPPLLTSAIAGPRGNGSQLRIGFISTELKPPYRGAAINLALQQGQADGLLPGYNFSIVYNVTNCTLALCDVKDAMFDIVNMHEIEAMDVLFGPIFSPICSSSGYLLSYWNVPHFPENCADSSMDDKTIYDTMIRISGSWGGLGTAILYFLQNYGWHRLAILTDGPVSQCNYVGTALNTQLSSLPNMTYTWIRMTNAPSQDSIVDYLNRVKSISRTQDMNMTNGDYVLITYSTLSNPLILAPWKAYGLSNEDMSYRIKAFYAVKLITVLDFSGPNATSFLDRVRLASATEAPWYSNFTGTPSSFAAWLYDSVYMYMMIADRMLRNGYSAKDIVNGRLVSRQAIGIRFTGLTGNVLIDRNGDRVMTSTVWTFGSGQKAFCKYMLIDLTKQFDQGSKVISVYSRATWGVLGTTVPSDTPACGFYNEFCPPTDNRRIAISVGSSIGFALVLVGVVVAYWIRSRRNEAKIRQMLWKIDYNELLDISQALSRLSRRLRSTTSATSTTTIPTYDRSTDGHLDSKCTLARFRGNAVAVYPIDKKDLHLTRLDQKTLISLKELRHDNILTFVGVCVEPGHMCYVMSLCSRGTLRGMLFLHKSTFQSHGHLKSTQCHIDSRWVLKIGGFGLDFLQENIKIPMTGQDAHFRQLLWTAPELLRMEQRPSHGTQKGDVYSFAIIVQEIAYRAQPYFCEKSCCPKLIVEMVSNDCVPCYRPSADESGLNPVIVKLMKLCWSELPTDRPTFDEALKIFRQVHRGKRFDIVDNMLQKLEKYAENLEDLVQQRTSELEDEKQKTDRLLCRMLPKFIADELKAGHAVVPQLFPSVTIYFSDIVGFTTLSSESSPIEVVDLLNDLYGLFDDTISRHDVYKVETIGDAYMVVSGLPKPNSGKHICEICNMALDLLSEVDNFVIRHRPHEKLKLRIGIHTGPCAAGVVGHIMPRYCLFGDTVNVASRMESTGEALKIHLSESAQKSLAAFEGYVVELRGETFVKGKGVLATYWLTGKK